MKASPSHEVLGASLAGEGRTWDPIVRHTHYRRVTVT
jgi:hypothetical protein